MPDNNPPSSHPPSSTTSSILTPPSYTPSTASLPSSTQSQPTSSPHDRIYPTRHPFGSGRPKPATTTSIKTPQQTTTSSPSQPTTSLPNTDSEGLHTVHHRLSTLTASLERMEKKFDSLLSRMPSHAHAPPTPIPRTMGGIAPTRNDLEAVAEEDERRDMQGENPRLEGDGAVWPGLRGYLKEGWGGKGGKTPKLHAFIKQTS